MTEHGLIALQQMLADLEKKLPSRNTLIKQLKKELDQTEKAILAFKKEVEGLKRSTEASNIPLPDDFKKIFSDPYIKPERFYQGIDRALAIKELKECKNPYELYAKLDHKIASYQEGITRSTIRLAETAAEMVHFYSHAKQLTLQGEAIPRQILPELKLTEQKQALINETFEHVREEQIVATTPVLPALPPLLDLETVLQNYFLDLKEKTSGKLDLLGIAGVPLELQGPVTHHVLAILVHIEQQKSESDRNAALAKANAYLSELIRQLQIPSNWDPEKLEHLLIFPMKPHHDPTLSLQRAQNKVDQHLFGSGSISPLQEQSRLNAQILPIVASSTPLPNSSAEKTHPNPKP